MGDNIPVQEPVPAPAQKPEEIFLDEFVRVGSIAQLFQNPEGIFEASNTLIDLLIGAIPVIDQFLALTPYKHQEGNLKTAVQPLEFLKDLVQQYDSYLRERKRETVRRKLEEHLTSLNHGQRVRYILIQFGMPHYRIFERSFDTIRVDQSHDQAIRRAATELATVFIKHLADEKEDIPQHLLQSFMWRHNTFLWMVWRGIKVLFRSYEFQDYDGVGISTFNFHTFPVVIFKRQRGQQQLWAKKTEMKKQASFFGKDQEFDDNAQRYLGLKLIRTPYSFEQTLFNEISEEQLGHEYEDVTTIVQNRMEIGHDGEGERNREERAGGGENSEEDEEADDDNPGGGGRGDDVVVLRTFQDPDQDEHQRQVAISSHLVRMEGDAPSITIEDIITSFRSLTQSVLSETEVAMWKLEIQVELRKFVTDKMLKDKKFKIDSSAWATAISLSGFVFAPLAGPFSLPPTLSTWSPSNLSIVSPFISEGLSLRISNAVKEADEIEHESGESCSIPPIQMKPAAVEILNYALEPLHIKIPETGKFPRMKENEFVQSLTSFKE